MQTVNFVGDTLRPEQRRDCEQEAERYKQKRIPEVVLQGCQVTRYRQREVWAAVVKRKT